MRVVGAWLHHVRHAVRLGAIYREESDFAEGEYTKSQSSDPRMDLCRGIVIDKVADGQESGKANDAR